MIAHGGHHLDQPDEGSDHPEGRRGPSQALEDALARVVTFLQDLGVVHEAGFDELRFHIGNEIGKRLLEKRLVCLLKILIQMVALMMLLFVPI